MSRCEKCGEYVDWDDPNIHYGGHVCKIPWNGIKTKDTEKYQKAIDIIKSNYPPSNYAMLREALDLAIEVLKEKL